MDRFFKLIILIGLTLMWFVFGTMMIVRGSKEFSDLRKHTGQVARIWTDISKNVKGRPTDVLLFNINGLNQTIGIYHNTIADYKDYLDKIRPGDTVTVYFNDRGGRTFENYNFHVYQLEAHGQIFLDKEKRNRTDRKVGTILYGIGLIFSIAPIWFYRKKFRE